MENLDDERPRRSIVSEKVVFVRFLNRSRRTVDLFWLNYNGQKIKYATLGNGEEYQSTTYETHPWVFRDTDTFDTLVANNKDDIFYPIPWSGVGDIQPLVTIDTPLWPLKEICIQKVRKLYDKENLLNQELPMDLKRDVCHQEDRSHGLCLYFEEDI